MRTERLKFSAISRNLQAKSAAMLLSILSGDATVDEATETAAQEMNDVFAGG